MKEIAYTLAMIFIASNAAAVTVASGTIKKFSVGQKNFAIYIEASSVSPCQTGWFYAYKTDMDVDSWKALQSLALTAYATEKNISIYAGETKCGEGTNSRFYSMTSI